MLDVFSRISIAQELPFTIHALTSNNGGKVSTGNERYMFSSVVVHSNMEIPSIGPLLRLMSIISFHHLSLANDEI